MCNLTYCLHPQPPLPEEDYPSEDYPPADPPEGYEDTHATGPPAPIPKDYSFTHVTRPVIPRANLDRNTPAGWNLTVEKDGTWVFTSENSPDQVCPIRIQVNYPAKRLKM